MDIHTTRSVAVGTYRSIWRSQFTRICVPLLIVLGGALDSRYGTSMFTLLCLTTTALLPLHLLMHLRREKLVEEQTWSSELDTVRDTLGTLLAYALATITILGLCWIAAFPFSGGQGGGTRLMDGTHYAMTTRMPLNMFIKVFFSTTMVLSLLLLLRRWRSLGWGIAVFNWLYGFALGGLLGMYANVYGLANGTFPALYQIISFPPLANYSLYAAPWSPWVLPSLGFIVLCTALAIWWQRRSQAGTISLTPSALLFGVALLGLMLFVIGEYRFVQFLRTTYQGYF